MGFPTCKGPLGMNFLPPSSFSQSWSCFQLQNSEALLMNQTTNILKLLIERLWLFCLEVWPLACHFLSCDSGFLYYLVSGWSTWALSPLQFWSLEESRSVSPGNSYHEVTQKALHSANNDTCKTICVLYLWSLFGIRSLYGQRDNRILWTGPTIHPFEKIFLESMPCARC